MVPNTVAALTLLDAVSAAFLATFGALSAGELPLRGSLLRLSQQAATKVFASRR